MRKEQIIENSGLLDQCPFEPDFGDELSILNARPVVPLKHIREQPRQKSRWFLLGAFALALFLGATSGFISGYFKLREFPEAAVIQSDVSSSDSLSYAVAEDPHEHQEPKLVTPKGVVTSLKRARRTAAYSNPLPQLSEDEELRRIREGLLIDDSQKRRVRSTERREQLRF